MLPSVPTASIFGAVTTVAAVAVLIGVVVSIVNAYRERGTPGRPVVPPLERAQTVLIGLGVVGLAVGALADSDVADAAMVVGVFGAVAVGVVRWRRGEPPLPRGL